MKQKTTSWNLKVHYCVHMKAQVSPLWAKLIQSMTSHSLSLKYVLTLSSHLHLDLPSCVFPSVRPPKPHMHLSSMPYMHHALRISVSLIWSPEQSLMRTEIIKLLTLQISFIHFLLPSPSHPNIFLTIPFLNNLNLCPSLNVQDQIPFPHKTTRQRTVLCIS